MQKSVQIFWRVFFIALGSGILFLIAANFGLFGKMPSIAELENPSASLASQVYADDGTLMGKYYLQDRVNVNYKDISKHVVNALVATEDERFYEHSGVDGRSLARAFIFLGRDGGASTITMQTAKNLFTDNWATRNILLRSIQKIKEGIIAIKLEKNFTKEEIITLYLNTVPFGDNVYGIRNAAKTFFQKEPDRLNIEEAAVLIGMLKGRTLYNPRRNPKLALDRRNTVLDQMVRNNYLDEAVVNKLQVQPIQLNYKKLDETTGLGPYFRMVLGEEMKKWCKEHKNPETGENYDLYRNGLKIYTSINPRMQLYAEEAVGKHMSYMQKLLNEQADIRTGSVWKGFESVLETAMKASERWKNGIKDGIEPKDLKASFNIPVPMKIFAWNKDRATDTVMTPMDSIKYHRQMLQAGFMAMDPITGEVKAWVGGIDFKNFKYDHVNANTKRQVGSTIKPLLYSLAIEDAGFTPNTPVVDIQQDFGTLGKVPATTTSCSGATMPMAQALAQSRNCATAYILKQIGNGSEGAKRFIDFLRKCNVQTKLESYPSIALGACEISLIEMLQAYSIFPGRGFGVKPMYISRIEDRHGNVLQNNRPQRTEIISDVTSYSIISMMQGVMKFGTGRRIWSYDVEGEVAGKTGTTNSNSDAWFMGYTPQLIGGVWTGCDDRFIRFKSTSLGQGSSVALPIWAYFYAKASRDKNLTLDTKSTFAKPDVMQNDINYDWMNNNQVPLGAEGDDMGNGTAEDYGDMNGVQPEEIAPESDIISAPETKPKVEEKKGNNPPTPNPVSKDPQVPKAVLPKKNGIK